MAIAIVGDIHSNLDSLHNFIDSHPDVNHIIQVGDLGLFFSQELAKKDKDWERWPEQIAKTLAKKTPFKIPVYFIKGNHEEFESLESPFLRFLNIHYIKQAEILTLEGYTFGCLGGIYSPKYFHQKAESLVGQQKRFFTQEEVSLLSSKTFDYLIMHEGPFGVIPKAATHGSLILRNLISTVKPKITFHGHHHQQYRVLDPELGEIHGLGNFSTFDKSYKILS